jgi:hypothetical protein
MLYSFLSLHRAYCSLFKYAHQHMHIHVHSTRRTAITRLILNTVRLAHKNTTCCHSTKVSITK